MKFRFLMSAMLAIAAFCATPTWAKAMAPSKYNITLNIQQTGCTSFDSGPCTGGIGWANYCPSGGCNCCTYIGTASGSAGNGTVTFYETVDTSSGDVGFDPLYGEIDIDGSKDDEVVVFLGVDLRPGEIVSGSATENFLNGGCIIWNSDVFTGGGFAKCSGNYSATTKTKFTIKGQALK